MTTEHRYIDRYPIDKECEMLIVGTIHPHDHEKSKIPFYYGNRMSLWNIFSEAFPDQLTTPITLERVREFLRVKKIALSDTVRACERKNPTALDKDLIPTKLNKEMVEQIRQSKIKKIFFTSGFGKNNAFKLFYEEILGLPITKGIKQNKRVMLERTIFGREVELIVLVSPSGMANVALSRSRAYKRDEQKFQGFSKPVHAFKVAIYKAEFESPAGVG